MGYYIMVEFPGDGPVFDKNVENKYVHTSPGYVWPNTLPYDDCTGQGCEGILV
jgi:hypothetical protein